jgi:hypothetical protein
MAARAITVPHVALALAQVLGGPKIHRRSSPRVRGPSCHYRGLTFDANDIANKQCGHAEHDDDMISPAFMHGGPNVQVA